MTASLVSSGLLCISWLMSALGDVVTSLAPTGRAAPEGHCPERPHSSGQGLKECAWGSMTAARVWHSLQIPPVTACHPPILSGPGALWNVYQSFRG